MSFTLSISWNTRKTVSVSLDHEWIMDRYRERTTAWQRFWMFIFHSKQKAYLDSLRVERYKQKKRFRAVFLKLKQKQQLSRSSFK